jgi:hypothetical protein
MIKLITQKGSFKYKGGTNLAKFERQAENRKWQVPSTFSSISMPSGIRFYPLLPFPVESGGFRQMLEDTRTHIWRLMWFGIRVQMDDFCVRNSGYKAASDRTDGIMYRYQTKTFIVWSKVFGVFRLCHSL